MCERMQAAVDMLSQSKKAITKGEIVMVFKEIIEDSEKMGARMTEIERRMTSMEEKMDAGFKVVLKELEDLQKQLEKRPPTLFEKILALKDHKLFWITLIIGLLTLGALLGVPATEYRGILNLGG